ncbi:MAG: hypothetical protein D6708_16615, partial [Candidatus Dadabacteria bacterium]
MPAGATHYPPGALCYDCHAISTQKIVPGTHLLRQSQKTLDLGITAADPQVRCLFCHERYAVSVENRTVMLGVWDHFNANSRSKHRANEQSTFTDDGTAGFDCLDCHTGITSGVVPDGAGNADIHGVDASAGPLSVASTLIGSPADTSGAELTNKVCGNAACHGQAGNSYGAYTAPVEHPFTNGITLNDGAAPQYCTDCHGTHNSTEGDRLLVLLNTSGANGQPATNRAVALDECEVCHTQDENGGLTDNFAQYGHGRVGVTCDVCHELSHDADNDGAFDPAPRLKASLQEDTAAGTSTFGTNFYSNCKNCHGGHAAHTPTPASGGFQGSTGYPTVTGRSAGCRDCHDQHGTTAADSTFQNDTMIRRTIQGEDVRLPDDGST